MEQPTFARVACYVRVSTENQLENYSIPEQTERLKAYCQAKGWKIYKVYPDAGYSGGNTDRPALQQMLEDIQSGIIDMVAVYKLDRLSRSQKDTLTLIEDEFITHNVEFVSMSENFDTSTPFGRAMIGILSVFAQLEKDQITERFTMGRIGRSKAGYYHGGSTHPFGYDYIGGKLIINEYDAAQVREVYNRFLNGQSINSIYADMHKKYGGWRSAPHTLNVLRNTVYIGKVKFRGVEYDGIHEPIIDTKIFNQVQELLNSSKREGRKTAAQKTPFRAGYLLSSLVNCARCEARYSANHGYYKCYSRAKSDKKYITDPNCKNDNYEIEKLDNLIINEIKKLQFDDDYFNKSVKQSDNSAEIKRLQNRIADIDKQINRLLDLYQIGSLPLDGISARTKDLQNKKKVVEDEITKIDVKDKNTDKIKEFKSALSCVDNVFKIGNLEEKRLLVSTLIEGIYIDGQNVTIKWRI